MDSLADTVASLELDDNETMPYGSSHWDRKPAEVNAMILKAAGPLTLLVNGLLADKDSLDEATVEALWTDVISIDWQGDLARLPDITIYAGEANNHEHPALDMLSLPVSRSMYGRLCTRFPDQAVCYDIDPRQNQYQVDSEELFGPFESTRFRHIPMRNGWFDLIDFSHPIALGWIAIYYGHAALLKHLAEHHGVDLAKFHSIEEGWMAMDMAAQKGHVDVLQMLHDAGNTLCSHGAMYSAAAGGHLEVVKWLFENRTEGWTTKAMDLAAENGHLHVVKWLHENRTEGCTTKAMDRAAAFGHLDVVKWLHENRTEGCTTEAIDCAAMNGHLETVQWLHANRTEGCTTNAMDGAAGFGHLDVVQWLHANRTEGCTTEAIDSAAMNCRLDVVKWLHENRTEGCTTNAIDMAAWGSELEVVQFLVECGYEFTFDALRRTGSDAIIDALVDRMTLARTMEMLQMTRDEDDCDELIARLERAVEEKQA